MLSLYVHIPFCVNKCPYCGFFSTIYSESRADRFIEALCREAAEYKRVYSSWKFNSVYIGGGTPTALTSGQLERIFRILSKYFDISGDAEFTIEANPNTASRDLFRLMRRYGVNRLSLGVQSFDTAVLKILGRVHSARESISALELARGAGFHNVGIDLIYGIPGQNASQWEHTLETAISLRPEHISSYCLSLDEGSRFMKLAESGTFSLPDEEQTVAMHEQTDEILGRAGYLRYEISNYSLPGYSCKHNMNYWQRGEYLGIGPSAWSFVEGKRYRTIADVKTYSERLHSGIPVREDEETAESHQAVSETLLLGIRTVQGVDLEGFQRTFGGPALERLEKNAGSLLKAGLLERTEGRIRLTSRGLLLADEALKRLDL